MRGYGNIALSFHGCLPFQSVSNNAPLKKNLCILENPFFLPANVYLNNSPFSWYFFSSIHVYHKYNTNWWSPVGMEHLVREAEEEESEERPEFVIKSNKCIYLRFSPKTWDVSRHRTRGGKRFVIYLPWRHK